MKKLIFIALIAISFSCGNTKKINQTVILPQNNQEILLGEINKVGLSSGSYGEWFNANYEAYQINEVWTSSVTPEMLKGIKVKLILGTWCGDSRREVPCFYKIMEAQKYPIEKMEVIAVDREKKAKGFDIEKLGVTRVPTFIFYRNNIELGRIIESPKKSLEEDLIEIISNE